MLYEAEPKAFGSASLALSIMTCRCFRSVFEYKKRQNGDMNSNSFLY
jgi:hypothetical protein